MPLIITLFLLLIPLSTQAQKLDASYKGEDLLLVDGYFLGKQVRKYQLAPKTPDYSLSKPFHNVYWNPANNLYYYAKAGSLLTKTNGLTYKLDPAKTNATLVYHPKARYAAVVNGQKVVKTKKNIERLFARNLQPDLAFAGWISSNQRLFIHIPTQEQYLQTLTLIDDPYEVIPWLSFEDDWPAPYVSYEFVDLLGVDHTPRWNEGWLLLRD